jgi:pimeloyl-ACP methyl ester carboxylesterase
MPLSIDALSTRPPSKLLLMLEGRTLAEYLALWLKAASMKDLPRGDGHAVLVIPGFGASDISTAPLRRILGKLGYAPYGWGQGRNTGMRPAIKQATKTRLEKLHAKHAGKVTLIGHSLGGVFAREMARANPHLVRRVITMGSPINVHPNANNLMGLFRLINRGKAVKLDLEGFERRIKPPPVPCTAIYTRSDGIVAWKCCLEDDAPNVENVEVRGSHMGLAHNSAVIRLIAERLATPG